MEEPAAFRSPLRIAVDGLGLQERSSGVFVRVDDHGARVAIDGNGLPMRDARCAIADAEHRRDAVFARNDGAVCEDRAHVSDKANGVGEELGPCRCR